MTEQPETLTIEVKNKSGKFKEGDRAYCMPPNGDILEVEVLEDLSTAENSEYRVRTLSSSYQNHRDFNVLSSKVGEEWVANCQTTVYFSKGYFSHLERDEPLTENRKDISLGCDMSNEKALTETVVRQTQEKRRNFQEDNDITFVARTKTGTECVYIDGKLFRNKKPISAELLGSFSDEYSAIERYGGLQHPICVLRLSELIEPRIEVGYRLFAYGEQTENSGFYVSTPIVKIEQVDKGELPAGDLDEKIAFLHDKLQEGERK